MKREELYILGDGDTAAYYKSESDAVMDAMEARIKELEEDYRKISEMYIAEQTKAAKYEQRIKELESDVKKWKQDNKYLTAYVQLLYNVKDANSPDIISTEVIAVANRLEKLESENTSLKAVLAARTTTKSVCDIIVELREENARLKAANFDLQSHFDVLKEDYEELKAQVPKWISVKDRLPKEGTWCIVFHDGEIDSDHYTTFVFNKKYDFAFYGNKVTHWMTLPQPPTTEESSATGKEK